MISVRPRQRESRFDGWWGGAEGSQGDRVVRRGPRRSRAVEGRATGPRAPGLPGPGSNR